VSFLPEPKITIVPHPASLTVNEKEPIVKKTKKSGLTLLNFLPSSLLTKVKEKSPMVSHSKNFKGNEIEIISENTSNIKPTQKIPNRKKVMDAGYTTTLTSSNTRKMFSNLKNCSLNKFRKIIAQVPDLNQKHPNKRGDTLLMVLLRRKELRADSEIPKIKMLLKYGALWTKQNNYGESAEKLAENHTPKLITSLKNI